MLIRRAVETRGCILSCNHSRNIDIPFPYDTISVISREIKVEAKEKGLVLNTFRRLIGGFLCFLMSPIPALCAPSATAQPAGQVRALIPTATKNAQATKVNDDLQWNDLLNTGPKGRLRAGLTDGSILSLGSSSELRVVQHDAVSQQTSLEMNLGKVRSKVVKITQPGGKFEVKTGNAVIGVIGTDFYVSYEPNKTTVICYTGKVWVTPIGDAKVIKNSGESTQDQVTVNAGQMVVINSAIPPAGFEPQNTPPDVQRASIEDTSVPDRVPSVGHPHLVRNLIIGAGVAAVGWTVGIKLGAGTPAPPQQGCNPKDGGCR
jgi:FecR protein